MSVCVRACARWISPLPLCKLITNMSSSSEGELEKVPKKNGVRKKIERDQTVAGAQIPSHREDFKIFYPL